MGKISIDDKLIELLEKYEKLIFSICFHITRNYFDSEDLTQETFLAVYKSLPSFDGQNEKAWITRIATNKCLDYMKRAEKRRAVPSGPEEIEDTMNTGAVFLRQTENTAMENQVKEQFKALCKQLKEPYGEIAYLYFCEENTCQEIALKSGRNIKTVETQIYRARSKLRKLWKKEDFA